MLRLLTYCLLLLLSGITTYSQQNIPPDVEKIMKMSPAEQKKYAEELQKKYIQQANSKKATALSNPAYPGLDLEIKQPVKDIKRLSLIPSRPPQRTELIQQVQQSKQQLQSVTPKPVVEEIKKFTVESPAEKLQSAAIANYYGNNPERALLLMMEAVQKQPDSVILWNNLGALYTMSGLEHRAVPLLQYCLEKVPGSSMILNNLGQAFMGLGDMQRALKYLTECIESDSMNPDANHSLGMLHMWQNEFDKAANCFARELEVCTRNSTLMYMKKMGRKVALRAIQKRKNSLNGRPQKNHFEEIALGKVKLPPLPKSVKEADAYKSDYQTFYNSVTAEREFWHGLTYSQEQAEAEGKRPPGVYHTLCQLMFEELTNEYTPEYLGNFPASDATALMEIYNPLITALYTTQCPPPPAGMSIDAQAAWETKCCEEIKRPKADAVISAYGSFYRPKMEVAVQRWKTMINEMIDIAQLDPSTGNQLMVYRTVGNYFAFLGQAASFGPHIELPNCKENYDPNREDSIIAADHAWRLECPSWLNVELDMEVGKFKADCSKYTLEVGSSIMGQYEYDFKKGTATFAAGYGVKAKFAKDLVKAGMKQMAFITFDSDGKFADIGYRGKYEVGISDTPIKIGLIKVGTTVAGVEANYSVGINSGFVTNVKGKGVLADFIKIDKSIEAMNKK